MTVLRPWWNLTVLTSQLLLNKDVTEFRAAPITCTIALILLLAASGALCGTSTCRTPHRGHSFGVTSVINATARTRVMTVTGKPCPSNTFLYFCSCLKGEVGRGVTFLATNLCFRCSYFSRLYVTMKRCKNIN